MSVARVATPSPAAEEGDRGREGPYVSVVVPVFNEEENLSRLVDELGAGLDACGRPWEVLLVDDGSTDGSFAELKRLQARDARLRVIRFRRNFGQTAAFAAGFAHAKGTWVITIDADLQNDPADIPSLLAKAEEGWDIVSGWRANRQDALVSRKIPSRVANKLIAAVTGVRLNDYGCSLKVYHRDVVKSIRLYGELHRFVPAVANMVGARVVEMPVNHRARVAGVSKYTGLTKTVKRAMKVFLDLLTVRFLLSYSTRPIHIFGGIGLLSSAVGGAIGLYLSFVKLALGRPIGERPLLLLAVLLMIVGVHFVTIGLLGELLVRTYHESQNKEIYAIREILEEQA
ncbi:glycosyltransferase family 2 protein [Vulgatibacter incomptus]|uniref:Glycosyl transferase, family 2 n=1 Tax=Vulgatibacter incomptus TaxID=1391653 RepID=A0A0K1PEI3_9BACT|nr:glycosyltransferase family 2 protein [Vulgatibacter incomptus]AKU91943.1 Glycosyl transferase, family 2 [Vulgatibacter incomptus]